MQMADLHSASLNAADPAARLDRAARPAVGAIRAAASPATGRRRRALVGAAVVATMACFAAACGGGGAAPQSGSGSGTADGEAAQVVRLALAPTATWNWLADSGELEAWERQHGVRVEASNPFAPFTAFVSGHADIVLVPALDVPSFADSGERAPVVFGKHSTDRSVVLTRRTTQAEDLSDVVEGRIAVRNELGSTLLWGLIAAQAHSLDLTDGSGDFDFVVSSFDVADVVERGEAAACICFPDQSVSELSTGMLHALYAGQPAGEMYARLAGLGDAEPLDEVLVADVGWLADNPDLADAFLDLWQRGLDAWNRDPRSVIEQYPQMFSVESDEQIAWLAEYAAGRNWAAETVRITEQERDQYLRSLGRLRDLGLIDADLGDPGVAVEWSAMSEGSVS